jgi:hypothetical protein
MNPIRKAETDAEGSPYEAHMTKADGSLVTVKVDTDFKVTSIEDGMGNGMGPGPHGPGGPRGPGGPGAPANAPAGSATSSSTA